MYLIRVEMDKNNPTTRRAMVDCQQMHRFVTRLFGSDRQSSGLLYRTKVVQDKVLIYLYSQNPVSNPDQNDIQQRDISGWMDTFKNGQVLNFDLVTSPSKKVSVEGKRNSQRKILRDPADRQAWLVKKAAESGFRILHAEEQDRITATGIHNTEKGGVMNHSGYRYVGTLQITDVNSFRQSLAQGIGPGKAYGFGMMLVKQL